MSDDDRQTLRELSQRLRSYAKGDALKRHQAAAYAEMLDRLHALMPPRYTAAQSLEQAIAMAYIIEQETRGRARRAGARKAIAKKNRISPQQVSNYLHEWGAMARARIQQLTAGMTADERATFLKRHGESLKIR